MSQQELLKKVLAVLNRHNVPYMLTGSMVSSIQGEPRLSHDIDIIISTGLQIADILKKNFASADFYLDEQAIRDAFSNLGMFNLIDICGGDKIDFWLLTESAFDNSRFSRKISITLFGETAWISTPEDTILAKMFWAKMCGGSEKQLTDIRQVFICNENELDRGYIDRWSTILGVKNFWDDLLGRDQ